MEAEPKPESNSPKDYILIILGALITLGTTIVINNINNKHEEKKSARIERIKFADSLMKGLAKRFTYVSELYNAKADKSTNATTRWQKLNDDLDIYLAGNVYYNYSRLRNLFNDSLAEAFKKTIDDPFDAFKDNIAKRPVDSLKFDIVQADQAKLDTTIHNFAKRLYEEAFKHE